MSPKLILHKQSKSDGQKDVTTSIKIRPKHLEFIKSRGVNLSATVRAIIESMIQKEKGK